MIFPLERHDTGFDLPRPVVLLTRQYRPQHNTTPHVHCRAQLMVVESGISRVTISGESCIVSPAAAIWIPAETPHVTQIGRRPTVTRSMYFSQCPAGFGKHFVLVAATGLLRALILEFANFDPLYDQDGAAGRMLAVLLDQLHPIPTRPLALRSSTDPHVQQIMEYILRHPEDRRSLKEWGLVVGSSEKTLTRRFLRETKVGFREWRQQARLLNALELLTDGLPVSAVSFEVGYESTSAFTAIFRATFGMPPGAYQDSQLAEKPGALK